MILGIIGGVERSEHNYREIAERCGHTLRFHGGFVGGRGADTLEALVRSVDLVVVVTDVNSHGAVQLARKAARRSGVPLLLQRRFRPRSLENLLDALALRNHTNAPISRAS